MENKRLKLPAGIQTFETIRKEGYIYVDKTLFTVKRSKLNSFTYAKNSRNQSLFFSIHR